MKHFKIISFSILISLWLIFPEACADFPRPWQLGFQKAASPVMERFENFHNMLLIIISCISAFVFFLLAYVCIRFRASKNPIPSKTSHNTFIEIIWTVIPVIILIIIAVPSFRILYYVDETPANYDMTLKVVGHQWYWEYAYPDYDNITFDSYMIADDKLQANQMRLLEVDNRVILPIDTNIKILITAADVIHSWAVPAFGIKTDAVPGRLNETWVNIKKPGVYYGQCSELCGILHGFMPIAVEAVTKEEFKQWLIQAKQKFAAGNQIYKLAKY